MTCKHCGAEIKDGMDYCMECGETTEEKAVIKTVTNIPIEARPFLDFTAYVKSLSSNSYTVLSLLGAICLYLSPFMKWIEKTVRGEKLVGGLFDMGAANGELSLGDGKLSIYAGLILVIGLYMLVMSGRKYIRPLIMHDNIIIKVVPIVLAIVVFVMIILNKTYSTYCELAKISLFSTMGPILVVAGIVLYGVSIFLEEKER